MTTATPTKPTAKVSKVTGKIAVIWSPEKDSHVPAPPVGSKSDRPFNHSWIADSGEVEKRRQLEEDAFNSGKSRQYRAMKTEEINFPAPGLHWVDAALWESAVSDDERKPEDRRYLARLLKESALLVLRPENGGTEIESISGFSYNDATAIIGAEVNATRLREWQKDTDDRRLVNLIDNRLREIGGGL